MTDLTYLSAAELHAGYRARRFSPVEVTRSTIDRITATSDRFNAFITVATASALCTARSLETQMMRSVDSVGGAFGVPVTVKDITATAGIPTTRGSARFADCIPTVDAAAVRRLKDSGAIIIGKTNTSEFAWKADAANPTFGPTLNPWSPSLTAGGSSGGAAVATAMGYGTWSMGTDACGSIRIPASFCHVVGLKPTLGMVPYHPPSAEFLSHFGPLARTVDDIRRAMLVMAGPDPRDPLSYRPPLDTIELRPPLRIGVLHQVERDAVSPTVAAAFDDFIRWFARAGHCLVPVSLPRGGADIIATIMMAFLAAEFHAVAQADLSATDPDLAALVIASKSLSAVELARAQTHRITYYHAILALFEDVDFVISPTVSALPFQPGTFGPPQYSHDVTQWHRWCSMSYPWNLAGNPAISLPWTRTVDGMPIGMQIIGHHGAEMPTLNLAAHIERDRPWIADYPTLCR